MQMILFLLDWFIKNSKKKINTIFVLGGTVQAFDINSESMMEKNYVEIINSIEKLLMRNKIYPLLAKLLSLN